MPSQRTSSPGDDKLLIATREAVVRHGVRRTTANDIAERAGVSRMTFYRRMGSVENAVLATLTREFRTVAADVRSTSPTGTGRDELVHFAIHCVRLFATSELLDSIAERDPEFLIPYVTDRFGASQQLILAEIQCLITAGLADHSIRATPATATTLLLALQGLALSARLLRKTGALEESLVELETMITRHLTPSAAPEAGGES